LRNVRHSVTFAMLSSGELRDRMLLVNSSGDLVGYRLGVDALDRNFRALTEEFERANPGCLANAKLV
jgi:hypothetical protein